MISYVIYLLLLFKHHLLSSVATWRGLHAGHTRSHANGGRGAFKQLLLSEVLVMNILSEVFQILHMGPERER